jgi:hypothetical protein
MLHSNISAMSKQAAGVPRPVAASAAAAAAGLVQKLMLLLLLSQPRFPVLLLRMVVLGNSAQQHF